MIFHKKNHFLFKNYFKGEHCLELLQYYYTLFFKRATILTIKNKIKIEFKYVFEGFFCFCFEKPIGDALEI